MSAPLFDELLKPILQIQDALFGTESQAREPVTRLVRPIFAGIFFGLLIQSPLIFDRIFELYIPQEVPKTVARQVNAPPLLHLSFDGHLEDTAPLALKAESPSGIPRYMEGIDQESLVVDGEKASLAVVLDQRIQFSTGMMLELWIKPDPALSASSGLPIPLAALEPLHLFLLPVKVGEATHWRPKALLKDGNRLLEWTATVTLPPNRWSRLAVSLDSREGGLFYVDGVAAGRSEARSFVLPRQRINVLRIGGSNPGSPHFTGSIDDLLLYGYPRKPGAPAVARVQPPAPASVQAGPAPATRPVAVETPAPAPASSAEETVLQFLEAAQMGEFDTMRRLASRKLAGKLTGAPEGWSKPYSTLTRLAMGRPDIEPPVSQNGATWVKASGYAQILGEQKASEVVMWKGEFQLANENGQWRIVEAR
ncbi:MAG: hypothetical protein HQL56_03365 [Magnetococcales bacterium]|nr:hypothetical protein [Magnetococcales bacterium]